MLGRFSRDQVSQSAIEAIQPTPAGAGDRGRGRRSSPASGSRRVIARRVKRLARSAEEMAAGSFDVALESRAATRSATWRARSTRCAASLQESFGVLTADRDKLAAIFDGLTDAVMVVDQDGRVRFFNSAAARLLGAGRPAPESMTPHLRRAAGRRLCRPPGAADRRPRLRDAGPRPAGGGRGAGGRPGPHRRDAPRVRRARLHLQRRPRAAQPAGGDLGRDRGPADGAKEDPEARDHFLERLARTPSG